MLANWNKAAFVRACDTGSKLMCGACNADAGSVGCWPEANPTASLQTTDGRQVNSAFEGQIAPGENLFTGVESGYTVSSGEYVLDVSSGCVWSVIVSLTHS